MNTTTLALIPRPDVKPVRPVPACAHCGYAFASVTRCFGRNLCAACIAEIDRDLEEVEASKRPEAEQRVADEASERYSEARRFRGADVLLAKAHE